MPLSMKIQPIEVTGAESEPITAKPVVKSRLKRLFRISVPEKDEPPPSTAGTDVFEPSSVCLAKMVQNFIEDNNNNDKHGSSRNRCNCFNGNGSDGSDGEGDNVTAADVSDFLKSLVVCASVNERNVLADTARVVAEKNKACKRKDELRKLVVEGLVAVGYDSAICQSKWDKSHSFPAGEYEYVDVILGDERLIIDIDFRSEFEVARSTKTYKSILQTLPNIFVGKSDRLSKIIYIISEAAKQSLKKKGMHIPPWRKADYVQAKWLSPPTRVVTNPITSTPPPTPITPIGSLTVSNSPSPNKSAVDLATILAETHPSDSPEAIHNCQNQNKPAIPLATILAETQNVDGSEVSSGSPLSETIFEMSESSGEEDVKLEAKVQTSPKKSLRIVTGLTDLMEHNP